MVTSTDKATLDLAAVSPIIDRYFVSFNAADYCALADLFEADGVLLAPFEEPIQGVEAIHTYLQAEAVDMRALALEAEAGVDATGAKVITVKGRVKTVLFTVAVRWTFALSPTTDKIQIAEIKLLASLQELVQFNRP